MDHPVAPQRPQGGKGHIIVLFAEIENIGPLQMAVQSIRHNADDLAAAIQAAGLGSLIGSHRIAGHQHKALPGGLAACLIGKVPVFRPQYTAAHGSHLWPVQQLQRSLCPEAAGTIQPQLLPHGGGIAQIPALNGRTPACLRFLQVPLQQSLILQKRQDMPGTLRRKAQLQQRPLCQLTL